MPTEALAQVSTMPVPGTRTEAWKYTRVGKLFKDAVRRAQGRCIRWGDISRPDAPAFDTTRVVFVNGHFRADLSDDLKADKGIVIDSLKHHLAHGPVKAHYGQVAPIGDRLFTAMNTAAPTDGLIILATKGTNDQQADPCAAHHERWPAADPTARPVHAARERASGGDRGARRTGECLGFLVEQHPGKCCRRRREPDDPPACRTKRTVLRISVSMPLRSHQKATSASTPLR